MADPLMEQLNTAESRRLELMAAREEREKAARAHEHAAREIRNTELPAIKEELAQLTGVLHNLRTQQRIETAEQAARRAQQAAEAAEREAESHKKAAADRLAAMEAKQAELDELLAKAKAAAVTIATPPGTLVDDGATPPAAE